MEPRGTLYTLDRTHTEALAGEVSAWEEERNAAESSIDWGFTSAEARIKLKHLYPEIEEESSYDSDLS